MERGRLYATAQLTEQAGGTRSKLLQGRCQCGGIVGSSCECDDCRRKRLSREAGFPQETTRPAGAPASTTYSFGCIDILDRERLRRLSGEAPPDVERDDDEFALEGPDDAKLPRQDSATIVCDGAGGYRVSPGWSATATCGIGDCVQAHEESHARDWRARWPNGCKNADGTAKPDGTTVPTGGEGYAAFLRASECRAYTGEVPCGEALLRNANDACKPVIQRQLGVWRSRKTSYCS